MDKPVVHYRFDFAISYASQDRESARQLAALLSERGARVFYDEWGRSNAWGKSLEVHLDDIYRRRARFCIVFISQSYAQSEWTRQELESALSARRERKTEYVLPLRLDDTDLSGLPPGIAHLDLRGTSLMDVADMACKKLSDSPAESAAAALPVSPEQGRRRPDDLDLKRFTRTLVSVPRPIEDAALVHRLLQMWPDEPTFARAQIARDLNREIGHRRRWHDLDDSIDSSNPYTCWRSFDKVYYSTLPGHVFKAQQTLEFTIFESDAPTLMLSAVWKPKGDEWLPMETEEYHGLFRERSADRSGCAMSREAAIYYARHKGYTFCPPVVPFTDDDEALCSWAEVSSEEGWFDWDRNPRLVGPSIGVQAAWHHRHHGCTVHGIVIQGGWRNSALFELHDSLRRLLSERASIRLLGQGCMRITLFVGSGRRPDDEALWALSRLGVAILRTIGAQEQWALEALAGFGALPRLRPEELLSFNQALEDFGSREHIRPWRDKRGGDEAWSRAVDFDKLPIARASNLWWGLSPSELAQVLATLTVDAGP